MLTIREIIKTFYNALLQRLKKYRGNWEQNDPTADDYIKNRPFYTDEINKEIIVKKTTFTTTESYEWCVPFFFEPVVGQMYTVTWDGKLYECVAYCDEYGDYDIGNYSIVSDSKDTGEPFFYYYENSRNYGLCVPSVGTHTIEISSAKVVKLDKKYLPDNLVDDLDLAPVATSGDYYDLRNRPPFYDDVIRYQVNQNLTEVQKLKARDNIDAASFTDSYGAVKYNISQSLTSEEKQRARRNIGAGTSSFSGSYNDLTNKPFPNCTTDDNGKFLRVVDGVATWSTISNAEGVSF